LQSLGFKSIDLAGVFVFLGGVSLDGVADAFSSGLNGLIVRHQSGLVVVNSVDFIVQGYVLSIQRINPSSKRCNSTCFLEYSCG
jgi:hypothetical protein